MTDIDTTPQTAPAEESPRRKGWFRSWFRISELLEETEPLPGAASSRPPLPPLSSRPPLPSSGAGRHLSGSSVPSDKPNFFSPALTIEGNVISESDIVVCGTVRGDISCRGDLELSGEVTGNVAGRNVRILSGRVQGNVVARESLTVEQSGITGDLSAATATIDGRIEGSITVAGTLSLLRGAVIRGDIAAGGLRVEQGATLTGQVTIAPPAEESCPPAPLQPQSQSQSQPQPQPAPDDELHASRFTTVMGIVGIAIWGLLLIGNIFKTTIPS